MPILTHAHIQTVVHFVASKNNLDIARRLFAHQPPASVRVRDRRGQYALHRAAAVGSVPMVNLLLQNKSPLNATDSDGQTALHHAVAEGHGEWSLLSSENFALSLSLSPWHGLLAWLYVLTDGLGY